MKTYLHKFDIDDELYERIHKTKLLAFDTETTGLHMPPARLCLVQMYFPEFDEVHMVHFPLNDGVNKIPNPYLQSKNLKKLLVQKSIVKIAHYARFDCLAVQKHLKISMSNIVCTKIMSQVCRTFSDKHGLKDLVRDLIGKNIDKTQQTSDWGRDDLTEEQKTYAAQDVIYLPELYNVLRIRCEKENRYELAEDLFKCIIPFAKAEELGFAPEKIMNPFQFTKH
jgi:ribonuclease D